jgi:D-alanyl-D-alanine carboxypeptidase
MKAAVLAVALVAWPVHLSARETRLPPCASRVAYAGAPLYAKAVELPPSDLALGERYPPEVEARLTAALAEASQRTGAPALGVAIADARGLYESQTPKRFYWASVGKAFTATAVLQLVEEGKLRLDDPLAKWFPDFPNAAWITVDDLLLHTAGIFSANEDRKLREKPRRLTPHESIALSARHGALFCPGGNWRYSNTGYTFLGLILEALEGKPYAEIIRARILGPLGLETLRVVTPEDPLTDLAPLTPKDGSAPVMSPAWAEAAGSVVGSAGDMLRFWHALLTGKLLSREATARRFERLYPMFDSGTFYGRGVMVYDTQGLLWLGHSGGTPGAKAVVAYSPSDRAFVAVALNTDGPAEAVANLLLRALRADPAAPPRRPENVP